VQNGNEKKILAAEPLVAEPVSASLDFRNPAPAGGKLEVRWEGPGSEKDFIAIAKPGAKADEKVAFTFLAYSEGNDLEVKIPTAPGTYELRYVQNGNERKILAAERLDVIPMTANLTAPESAAPGSQITVAWEGPGHRRDEIIIARAGSDTAEAYASVSEGNEVSLYAPTMKGEYEIRYVYGPLGKVLATRPLKVE